MRSMVLELPAEQLKERLRRGEITVAVYGLGYVGLPLAVAWMEAGARVIGVDIDEEKVEALNRGETPTEEPGVAQAIKRFTAAGVFEATTDTVGASRDADVKLVAVPTLLGEDKRFDGAALLRALRDVGRGLKRGDLSLSSAASPLASPRRRGVLS